MKKKLLALCFVVSTLGFVSCDKDENDDERMLVDQDFAVKATYSNRAEIEAGNVAVMNAQNAQVKAYGQQMITEHSMAQQKLDSIANVMGWQLPQTTDSAHIALKQTLMSLSGYAFDTTYMNSQIMDHQNTLNLMNNYLQQGFNAILKQYAQETTPKVQMHYTEAVTIRGSL